MARTPPRQPQDEAQIDAEINEGGPTPVEPITELPERIAHVAKSEPPTKAQPRKSAGISLSFPR